MRVKVSFFIIGVLGVVLALVLLLTPVSARIVDAPCGSVLVPTKVHYSDAGELVFANTPSCREVRMARLPVGHASAQMAWRGLRSRPTWRVLVYSNESPPERRGLVFVDGVDGSVVASHAEANPEDWSPGD